MSTSDYQEALWRYQDFCGSVRVEDTKIAELYLQKYWLSAAEYQKNWQPLHERIFDVQKCWPDMLFKQDWGFISLLGGVMFEKPDVTHLRRCMQVIGDQYFVVIQHTFGGAVYEVYEPPYHFRMKYPANISWEELMSGNYISTSLFEMPINNYYVFGDSGQWGMYVGSAEVESVNLIGFEKSYRQLFRTTFNIPPGEYCETMEDLDYIPADERPDLKSWVPEPYRQIT